MVMLLLLKQEINAMFLFLSWTRAKVSIQLTKMVREAIHFKRQSIIFLSYGETKLYFYRS